MSDTPRTDALLDSLGYVPEINARTVVNFTRELERELAVNRAENARLREALETISDGASSFGRWQLIARTALKDAAQSTPARDTLKADCCTHCLSCAHFDPARSWCSLHRGTTTPDYLCKDFACATLKEPNVSD